jgi:hypothetical protein
LRSRKYGGRKREPSANQPPIQQTFHLRQSSPVVVAFFFRLDARTTSNEE